jgi:hypothetical protein
MRKIPAHLHSEKDKFSSEPLPIDNNKRAVFIQEASGSYFIESPSSGADDKTRTPPKIYVAEPDSFRMTLNQNEG